MQSLSSSLLFFFFFSFITFPFISFSTIFHHSIHPNFTTTHLQSIDTDGAFLYSQNDTFLAAMFSSSNDTQLFHLSVVHAATNTPIWSANPSSPVSDSAELRFTTAGLAIVNQSNTLTWSTPPLSSPVLSLVLLETGNLLLLGANEAVLWQSFDHPTHTIVTGQRLRVGGSLVSLTGEYRLELEGDNGDGDLMLKWLGQVYWRLSMDVNTYKESKHAVSYLEMDSRGLILYGDDGNSSTVVSSFVFEEVSELAAATVGEDGRLVIRDFDNGGAKLLMVRPERLCETPNFCGKLGVCFVEAYKEIPNCDCPEGFVRDYVCLPKENSVSLPSGSACNVSGNGSSDLDMKDVEFLDVGNGGLDYFSTAFMVAGEVVANLSACQGLCLNSCSCLGLVFRSVNSRCALIENYLGSVFPAEESGLLLYVKAFRASKETKKKKPNRPFFHFVLISLLGFCVLTFVLLLVFLWLRKRWNSMSLGHLKSSSFLGSGSLFGYPFRFEYSKLVDATEGFSTVVGSGGFGKVFRGTLPDQSEVAVKKITNMGVRGKKEFLTELAVIGSIRHVNLVRLKGYCVHGSHHFLVYEFMKQGSLERILFGDGPVLEWADRFKIALGTARALAYLHNQCHHKIIHFDIKPENILLDDHSQPKLSDFGLSKLLDHETSKLVTAMRGTRGYLAPEWLANTGITNKADVFSFGMVLLEIVSGKRNLSLVTQSSVAWEDKSDSLLSSPSLKRSVYFPSLALEMHIQGRYLELADLRLEGRVSGDEVSMVVQVALCCVHVVPELRPTMDNVVAMFEGRLALGKPRVEALRFLQS